MASQQEVLKVKLVPTPEGSYLVIVLKNDPESEFFLATRRDRTQPKLFIDQDRLIAKLLETFPNIWFEATLGAPPVAS